MTSMEVTAWYVTAAGLAYALGVFLVRRWRGP